MNRKEMRTGSLYAIGAYIIWGFLPLYWKLLEDVLPMEVLAQRIIWAVVFMFGLLIVTRKFPSFIKEFKDLFSHWKSFVGIALASILISINWFTFIWSVQNDFVLQASLGYYINPLVSILLGIIVLREKVSKGQVIAFILAAIGVLYLTIAGGQFPWISLILAFSFAFYGLFKKQINLSTMNGLTIETLLIAPIALIYLFAVPDTAFAMSSPFATTNLLLIGGGIATAVPLLLFAAGAKTIPLSMIGILQFIAPTMMFLLGVFVFGEAFSANNLIAFLFIWLALAIYLISVYKNAKAIPSKQI